MKRRSSHHLTTLKTEFWWQHWSPSQTPASSKEPLMHQRQVCFVKISSLAINECT